jgi:hypothetical protein
MKHAPLRHLLPLVGFSLLAGLATAETALQPGQVACNSLKSAKNYVAYQQIVPAFAADLLARASCYTLRDLVIAVPKGRAEANFQAYTLLSGHTIWLPVAAR